MSEQFKHCLVHQHLLCGCAVGAQRGFAWKRPSKASYTRTRTQTHIRALGEQLCVIWELSFSTTTQLNSHGGVETDTKKTAPQTLSLSLDSCTALRKESVSMLIYFLAI